MKRSSLSPNPSPLSRFEGCALRNAPLIVATTASGRRGSPTAVCLNCDMPFYPRRSAPAADPDLRWTQQPLCHRKPLAPRCAAENAPRRSCDNAIGRRAPPLPVCVCRAWHADTSSAHDVWWAHGGKKKKKSGTQRGDTPTAVGCRVDARTFPECCRASRAVGAGRGTLAAPSARRPTYEETSPPVF